MKLLLKWTVSPKILIETEFGIEPHYISFYRIANTLFIETEHFLTFY
jgi:hypothetical protein